MPVLTANPPIVAEETYPIRNEHKGPSCFTHQKEEYAWGANGSAEGDDIQYIPGYVVKSPNFQRMLGRGLFSLLDTSVDYNAYQGEVWLDQQAAMAKTALSNLEEDDANELEQRPCQGPGARGTGSPCGETVFMRRSALETEPPLCDKHERYKKYFELVNGQWQRMAVGKES